MAMSEMELISRTWHEYFNSQVAGGKSPKYFGQQLSASETEQHMG
jgi:hypothetical protein